MERKPLLVRVSMERYRQLDEIRKARRWDWQTLLDFILEKFVEAQQRQQANGK